jgi:hypothetical protein
MDRMRDTRAEVRARVKAMRTHARAMFETEDQAKREELVAAYADETQKMLKARLEMLDLLEEMEATLGEEAPQMRMLPMMLPPMGPGLGPHPWRFHGGPVAPYGRGMGPRLPRGAGPRYMTGPKGPYPGLSAGPSHPYRPGMGPRSRPYPGRGYGRGPGYGAGPGGNQIQMLRTMEKERGKLQQRLGELDAAIQEMAAQQARPRGYPRYR